MIIIVNYIPSIIGINVATKQSNNNTPIFSLLIFFVCFFLPEFSKKIKIHHIYVKIRYKGVQ